MSFIRSISGVRATLGDALTPAIIADYCVAFSSILEEGPIVIGRDGRPSGVWMCDIVVGALRACGRSVVVLDMVPTPTVQLVVEKSDAAGGISITASHNPEQWNGLKFIASDGVFLDADGNARMWARLEESPHGAISARAHTPDAPDSEFVHALQGAQQRGGITHSTTAIQEHLNAILAMPSVKGAPRARGQTVVVDAVNSSGSFAVPELLEACGYTVVRLYCDGSGEFPHAPEPIAENLTFLGEAVREHGAAFGVAVDPDGDRLVLLDETGEPIGEELTIVLATEAVLSEGARGPVVVNYSTTRRVDDVAARFGCSTHRAPVGEINVVRRMQQLHAVIGGEGSGGVIDPRVHYGRDALVGIGLITSLLRTRGVSLKQAVASLPAFAMIKTKVALTQSALSATSTAGNTSTASLALERVAAGLHDASISREDGVYASWPDRWVHVRTSNTEPIMRIIVEAPYQHDAVALLARVTALAEM